MAAISQSKLDPEEFRMPQENYLISTDQLAELIGKSDLRLYDCTTHHVDLPIGSDAPYVVVSGRADFEDRHIPGANYLDLQADFSDNNTKLRYMLAPIPELEAAFARHGLNQNCRIVLYSAGSMMYATRFWWMLRSLGVDALVLDGGLDKWLIEGRPVEAGSAAEYPPTLFRAQPRPHLFVNQSVVLSALNDDGSILVNGLYPRFHSGLEPSRYGRPGRIPGSVNVPAIDLMKSGDRSLKPLEELAELFAVKGVTQDKNVICYCGGGISATLDLFVLVHLGFEKLSLYDGSLGEWARDANAPIEVDASINAVAP
jgi:thiosulfate/3-mercaptopyruvate sulfurtransferase